MSSDTLGDILRVLQVMSLESQKLFEIKSKLLIYKPLRLTVILLASVDDKQEYLSDGKVNFDNK